MPSQPSHDRPGQSLLPCDGTRLRISSVPVRIAQRSQALSWLLAKNAYRPRTFWWARPNSAGAA